jgi:ComF family protein
LSLPENSDLKDALLIPIPLSKKRLLWRGFNQSEILARELVTAFNYSISHDLKRNKYSRPQAELSEQERLNNIKDSFFWAGTALEGKTIILIDDVITTGATLNEAALTLKKYGAGKIYGLVLAKG